MAQEMCKGLHDNAQLAVINSSREVQITTEILRNMSTMPFYFFIRCGLYRTLMLFSAHRSTLTTLLHVGLHLQTIDGGIVFTAGH